MGRIVVTEFISLDGVVEDPGGAEGFKYGGWTFEFNRGPEGDAFKIEEARAAVVLLLGRVTYETFAANWPQREGELADKLNSMRKYVVSSTLTQAEWANSTIVKGDDLLETASKLKRETDGDVVVHGSVQVAQALLKHDLVDELRLMVFPVVLGTGKRLFGDPGEKKTLRLTDSKVVGEGIVILTCAAGPTT